MVSAHLGARPEHHKWQGKFYSRSGRDKRFPDFVASTGYGTVTGLCGANCRHSFGPGDGVNNPYDTYDSEENQKAYDLQQRQRLLERRIRKTKRQVMGLKAAADEATTPELKAGFTLDYEKKSALLSKQNAAYKQFCKENNLKELSDRLAIAKWDRKQAAAARGAAKRYENGRKTIENPDDSDIMKSRNMSDIYTHGRRNEVSLTKSQQEEAIKAAIHQGYDGEIMYSDHSNTSFHGSTEGEPYHYLVIGTDAYPAESNNGSANEKVSLNGCMAHEIVGHYETWKKGTVKDNRVLDEAQASIRASKFGVDLTIEERNVLWQDALDRLSQAGIIFDDVKNLLDIWER